MACASKQPLAFSATDQPKTARVDWVFRAGRYSVALGGVSLAACSLAAAAPE